MHFRCRGRGELPRPKGVLASAGTISGGQAALSSVLQAPHFAPDFGTPQLQGHLCRDAPTTLLACTEPLSIQAASRGELWRYSLKKRQHSSLLLRTSIEKPPLPCQTRLVLHLKQSLYENLRRRRNSVRVVDQWLARCRTSPYTTQETFSAVSEHDIQEKSRDGCKIFAAVRTCPCFIFRLAEILVSLHMSI